MTNLIHGKSEIHTATLYVKFTDYNFPIIKGIFECRDCSIRTYSQGANPPRIDGVVLHDTKEVIGRKI